jgi:RNA polymerase sigma-70 factor (ECF subfamily)
MDRGLVVRARDGDRDAFTQLAEGLSDRLYAIALRILRDGDAAGEALQAALVAIWRDLPSLRDPDRFDAWTYRVIVNHCRYDRRRARRAMPTLELRPDDSVVADTQAAVARRDELDRAFLTLSEDQRAVLVFLYYEDMTVGQVADLLGVSEGTVKSRAFAARRLMRAALDAGARPESGEERTA